MSIEIKVPVLPESVTEATVGAWLKKPGDMVTQDEVIVEVETDKVMLEVPAVSDGKLLEIFFKEGDTITAEQVLATLEPGAITANESAVEDVAKIDNKPEPADVEEQLEERLEERLEDRVPMSGLRKTVATRLLSATQETAMLTTFNELDMQAVVNLRQKYKEEFAKVHGVRLGFMSIFVKAAVAALKKFPVVNAYIDGDDIVYHAYCDIGVAVASERGLVVPVIKDAQTMQLHEIEKTIVDFAERAKTGKLNLAEISGGTFTISNGGVFGSMLSTPILNPPQSAILGMHKIQERPVVVAGEIVIRPMMYLALSYDHRIVDGKDAVLFLHTLKEALEDPGRLILGL